MNVFESSSSLGSIFLNIKNEKAIETKQKIINGGKIKYIVTRPNIIAFIL